MKAKTLQSKEPGKSRTKPGVQSKAKTKDSAMLDHERPIFPISVVADILKVHQRTLRIYDDAKLLVPSRSAKNRRLYSINDIEKGKFIQYLTKELGINLIGIKIIFSLLNKQNVTVSEGIPFVQEIAAELDITPEIQEHNKIRLSRRGRKPKNA